MIPQKNEPTACLVCEKCGPVQLTPQQAENPSPDGWHCPTCGTLVKGGPQAGAITFRSK
jgi:hypothetical protein